MDVSVITTCKGRLEHLKRALPSWLSLPPAPAGEWEILVVDYGCTDGAAEWCEALDLDAVRAVRVTRGTDRFCWARARNRGARAARGRVLCFLDADVLAAPDLIRRLVDPVLHGGAELCRLAFGTSAAGEALYGGQFAVDAKIFHQLRGLDESHRGYGGEDGHFYRRCLAAGCRHADVFCPATRVIPATDEERLRFQPGEASVAGCLARNGPWSFDLDRPVNPDGYGRP